MKIKDLILICLLVSVFSSLAAVRIEQGEDEGQECFVIRTESATYYYQKAAGGFSSIHDCDGIDWIQYNKSTGESYPESAASDYRGLPNMVFGSNDGGAGHPGFEKCLTIQVGENMIRTFSKSGLWQWSWQFSENDAILTVEQVDPEHAYWFLYEGPIAGRFDPPNQYWGNSKEGPVRTFQDYVKNGGGIYDQWDWVYFGDSRIVRIFLLRQLDPDDLPDTMGYMGASRDGLDAKDGMVVFGFGRYKRAKPVMTKFPVRFRIGFLERSIKSVTDHQALVSWIEKS